MKIDWKPSLIFQMLLHSGNKNEKLVIYENYQMNFLSIIKQLDLWHNPRQNREA